MLNCFLIVNAPFSPPCATFLAELCNPITRQAIELERRSNTLRIQPVLSSKSKKKFFVLGLSFSGENVTCSGVFALFWPSLHGPGRRPKGPFFWTQSLVEN